MREGVWGDGGGRRSNAPLESCSVGVSVCDTKVQAFHHSLFYPLSESGPTEREKERERERERKRERERERERANNTVYMERFPPQITSAARS